MGVGVQGLRMGCGGIGDDHESGVQVDMYFKEEEELTVPNSKDVSRKIENRSRHLVAQRLWVTLVTAASRTWWRQIPERSELKRDGEERNWGRGPESPHKEFKVKGKGCRFRDRLLGSPGSPPCSPPGRLGLLSRDPCLHPPVCLFRLHESGQEESLGTQPPELAGHAAAAESYITLRKFSESDSSQVKSLTFSTFAGSEGEAKGVQADAQVR